MTIRKTISRRKNTQRFTVQLSSGVFGKLRARAMAEGLPVSAVSRRAIMVFLMELANVDGDLEQLTPLDLAEFEDRLRRGPRGPEAQWPERVNYVLPQELAETLQQAATTSGRTVADLAREAIIRHVAFAIPEAPPLELYEDPDGFTRPRPAAPSQRRRR